MARYKIHLLTDKISAGSELHEKVELLVKYLTRQYSSSENIQLWICDEATIPEVYNQCYAPGNDVDFERDNIGVYSFRAFVEYSCRNICIFYTKYETPDSVLWMIAHEFAHYHIHKSPAFAKYMRYKNRQETAKYDFTPNYNDDLVHEMHFEERFCNDFANYETGDGNSDRCYDRVWWRNQKALAAAADAGKGE